MKNEKDLKNFNIRTDLVVDLIDTYSKRDNLKIKKRKINDIDILDVEVLKKDNDLRKDPGKYITISFKDITDKNNNLIVEKIFIKELKNVFKYLGIKEKDKCLVIGLGNIKSTPDSLGPKVIDNILVTRYLFNIGIKVDTNYRNVSAISPNVYGNTGIESIDIIKGIIKKIKPDFIILIDALASCSINRLNKTIQITTTGINPGSGVNNNRCEISYKTTSVKTISIGIPTVIDANVLVKELSGIDINNIIPMIITPNEIDFLIEKEVSLLSNGINKSLHQDFDI